MKLALRRPAWRRSLPVISARPGPALALPLAFAMAAGVGMPLALQGPALQEQSRGQDLRAAELARMRAAALSGLEVARARAHSAAAQPSRPQKSGDASGGRADRLMLHRLALQHGLRVQVLKTRLGPASGALTPPDSARQALSVEFIGSVEAASSYLTALGLSGPAWGLQGLEVLAGAAGKHRLLLQLEPLAIGAWPVRSWAPGSWASVRPGLLQPVHDPFALVPAPPVPSAPSAPSVPVAMPSDPPPKSSAEPPAAALAQAPVEPVGPPPMPLHWQAELKRERQPLEAHALRDLFLTGTLRQGLNWFALVRVGGIVHTLQVGDYVGPDLGLVRSVDEEGLDLREIGRDPSGQWVELPRRWRVGVSP